MSEYGVGSMSGDVRVPRTQKERAIKDADKHIADARRRYNKAKNYADRRRAEDDLAGAQYARQKYSAWRTEDD